MDKASRDQSPTTCRGDDSSLRSDATGGAVAWRTLCRECDGLGHDDDLLCPSPCDACNGTGLEEEDDDYPEWDEDMAQ